MSRTCDIFDWVSSRVEGYGQWRRRAAGVTATVKIRGMRHECPWHKACGRAVDTRKRAAMSAVTWGVKCHIAEA